jgi:hypothetical protein
VLERPEQLGQQTSWALFRKKPSLSESLEAHARQVRNRLLKLNVLQHSKPHYGLYYDANTTLLQWQ